MKTDLGVITQNHINDYADASGDRNPIHLNEAFAKSAGLPSTIAHGMLTMGLAAKALEESGFDISQLKNFEAKFKEKVFVNERLVAEIDLSKKEIRILKNSDIVVLTASWT